MALDAGARWPERSSGGPDSECWREWGLRNARCLDHGSVRSLRSTRRLAWCECCSLRNGSCRRSGLSGAPHVIGWIERLPPVGTLGDKIGSPDFSGDVPLRWFREVVVANFCEVTLLPDASVNESDIGLGKFRELVGGEVGDDRVAGCSRGSRTTLPSESCSSEHKFLRGIFSHLREPTKLAGDCGPLLGGFPGESVDGSRG